jgi:hypothetical protein
MTTVKRRTLAQLTAAYDEMSASPRDVGTVDQIVRRPAVDAREVVTEATFNPRVGLVGDTWLTRGSKHTADGRSDPAAQVTIMNRRIIALIAPDESRWPLAGDQLFVDFDLSVDNLPAGQRLQIGTVLLEVSSQPHTGCDKFTMRFGSDATRFVNSKAGRAQRRRGINTRVIRGGVVRTGDVVRKIDTDDTPA